MRLKPDVPKTRVYLTAYTKGPGGKSATATFYDTTPKALIEMVKRTARKVAKGQNPDQA